MGRIAFLFSGQGAQFPGMAKEFYESSRNVRELFDAAEEIHPGTLKQCFSGTPQELKQTENTQPCLYLADFAAAIAACEAGIDPDAAAGFSLGELPALAFAGAFDPLDGFRLVCERGRIMAKYADAVKASMMAVVKLPHETVEAVCAEFDGVWPVNYNTPEQLVVSGFDCQLKTFEEKIREKGGRCIPLAVGGGFHSPLMDGAATEFEQILEKYQIRTPVLQCYTNSTGALYESNPKALLSRQINHPVRWQQTVAAMLADGVTVFIETGVGSVLTKMVQRMAPEAVCRSVQTPREIELVMEELR
ncbi:MAG TPA: ACP S-malonyltransferase [Oscillospiraceae bacterium]|nr:ACP S-malonyltransferase [Oscillospiraceae bacterium]HPF55579.1 ACP S-malonyltransferase [Clostridiales bacterium]HPK35814.1 ACP S-malonyltransferase [Oscillospiraceae bacterium]HPR76332.1 ACP S-malonyltransferase [Oscillospiraceae bacterium]